MELENFQRREWSLSLIIFVCPWVWEPGSLKKYIALLPLGRQQSPALWTESSKQMEMLAFFWMEPLNRAFSDSTTEHFVA